LVISAFCPGRLRADDSHGGSARQPAKSFRRIGNLDDGKRRGTTSDAPSMHSGLAILWLAEIAFLHRIVVPRENVTHRFFCIAPQ
jgi:hypothetical protein